MGEPAYSLLPVILVSAKDKAAASHIISEIIDNDVTEVYKAKEGDVVQDRVWRIVNKYYTADVKLQASGDEELPGGDEPIDAHVIYLQEDECAVSWCARRSVPGGEVRLLLCAGAADGALLAWAAKQRYELVPLAAPASPPDELAEWAELAELAALAELAELGADDSGVPRARAALHAHAWRGLVRLPARAATLQHHTESECESPRASPEPESEAEEDVERAEAFAAALGALGGAASRARADDAVSRDVRLALAETLLHDFCRALGLQLDDC